MGKLINLQQYKLEVVMGNPAPRTPSPRATSVQSTMVNNVAYFYNKRGKDGKKDPKWRQNQPRGKTIENVAIGKTDPQLSTLELIADKAGIPVWYFLLPLPEELLQDLALNELVEAYISTDDKGRQAIISVSKIVSK